MGMERFTGSIATANQGLTPNTLVNAYTGAIDYTRSSWSRSSWSAAAGTLRSSWSRSSWSCNCSKTSTRLDQPDSVELEPQLLVLDHGLAEVAAKSFLPNRSTKQHPHIPPWTRPAFGGPFPLAAVGSAGVGDEGRETKAAVFNEVWKKVGSTNWRPTDMPSR